VKGCGPLFLYYLSPKYCCVKYLLLPLFLLSICISGVGQSSYKDSILSFQDAYKKDMYTIIQDDTAFVRFYPIDPFYRVTAKVELLIHEKFFPMATSGGITKQAIKYVLLTFNYSGKEYKLYGYQLGFLLNSTDHKDDFFIPFTDAGSGTGSYGGGRYIDFVVSDITPGKTLAIDFNKAYNPYCAFKPGYTCPIPPKENNLPFEMRAGEMNFGKSKH